MSHATHMNESCYTYEWVMPRIWMSRGIATMSRLLLIIGLFCQRALQKRLYSAKETYNFKEPNNHSHPICRTYQRLCVTHLRRVSHISSHVTHMNKSCHTREEVMENTIILLAMPKSMSFSESHICMSHISRRMSHDTHLNEWMSHVTHLHHTSICLAMPKSMSFSPLFTIKICHTYEWFMSHI